MPKITLTRTEKDEMAALYRAKEATQEQLSVHYGVSTTTVRRALQEYELVRFSGNATKQERSLLKVIKSHGITDPSYLNTILNRGINDNY